ncbi:MAG TPA: hypothetical protein VNZ44_19725 [Pyrinomonadaceae bacterium]|nr:hypothetical protein [Pyrinomonadaceae bacterium]
MKRFLLPLLVLCAALAPACQNPAPNDNNSNRGPNQNGGNINQGVTVNTNTPTPQPPGRAESVTITVGHGNKISVDKDPIYLSKGAAPILRFDIDNKLAATLAEVKVEFKSPAGNPMAGPYAPVVSVGAGTHAPTIPQPLRPGAANGKYKYTITVKLADGTTFDLDPEVEVGT